MGNEILERLIELGYVTMYHLPNCTVPVLTEEGLEFLERNFGLQDLTNEC